MSDERRPSDADAGQALPPPPPRYDEPATQTPASPRGYPPRRPQVDAPTDIIMTLVSAGLFLYVGFIVSPTGVSDSAVYNGAVDVFRWGARGIGIAILACAGLGIARLPGAITLDLIISAAATLLCAGVGAIYLAHGDSSNGVLLLIFTLVNGSSVRGAWLRWRGTRGDAY